MPIVNYVNIYLTNTFLGYFYAALLLFCSSGCFPCFFLLSFRFGFYVFWSLVPSQKRSINSFCMSPEMQYVFFLKCLFLSFVFWPFGRLAFWSHESQLFFRKFSHLFCCNFRHIKIETSSQNPAHNTNQ